MKAFLANVYHHGKVKFKLVQFNFLTLLVFEALYTLVATQIIYPGSFFLLNLVLEQWGFGFLSVTNIFAVLSNPVCLLIILAITLIFGFFALFELTTLIVLFNESHFKRHVSLVPLCQKGLERAVRIVKLRNFPLLIFVLIIIPFTEFSLSSSFIGHLSLPGFMMSYIFASPTRSLIYDLVSLGLLILVVEWIFSLHYFTLEDHDFTASTRKSRALVKGHFWHTAFWVAFWNAAVLLLLFLIFGSFELISTFVLGLLLADPLALSIFVGGFGFLVSALFTIFQLIETSITFALVSMFYYDYSESAGIAVASTALIKTPRPPHHRKKLFIGISVVTIFLIFLINSYVIFQSFHESFPAGLLDGPPKAQTSGQNALAPPTEPRELIKQINDFLFKDIVVE